MSTKQKQLESLKDKMLADDNLPLKETATTLVFGEGSLDPIVYFLGEAPGKYEDLSGRPFVGQAGKLLDKLLSEIDLKREDVYITSVLRYRPPQNRDPKPAEIESFKPYLDKEISILKPKIIATLGRFSLNKFLPDSKISKVHGVAHPITYNGFDIIIFPLYHPAAALRRREFFNVLQKDFLMLKHLINQDL